MNTYYLINLIFVHIILNKVLTGVVWQMSDAVLIHFINSLIYGTIYEGTVFWQAVHLIHCYL